GDLLCLAIRHRMCPDISREARRLKLPAGPRHRRRHGVWRRDDGPVRAEELSGSASRLLHAGWLPAEPQFAGLEVDEGLVAWAEKTLNLHPDDRLVCQIDLRVELQPFDILADLAG